MYKLHLLNNHMFADIDGNRWLIDTGAPITIGDVAEVEVGGRAYTVSPGMFTVTAGWIREKTAVDCCGLIGCDVLNDFTVVFDLDGGTIEFTEDEDLGEGLQVPLTSLMGIPIATVEVAGDTYSVALDTGAQHSILQSEVIDGFPEMGEVQDFGLMQDQFTLSMHRVDVKIGGTTCALSLGRNRAGSILAVQGTGLDGAIGQELFRGRKVTYCANQAVAVLNPAPA